MSIVDTADKTPLDESVERRGKPSLMEQARTPGGFAWTRVDPMRDAQIASAQRERGQFWQGLACGLAGMALAVAVGGLLVRDAWQDAAIAREELRAHAADLDKATLDAMFRAARCELKDGGLQ